MADRDRDPAGSGHGLKRHRPETTPPAVAPATRGGHQERRRLRRDRPPHGRPPAAPGCRSPRGGGVLQTHPAPPGVAGPIVDARGTRLPQVRIGSLRRLDLVRPACGVPGLPRVATLSHPCLVLRINRPHRRPLRLPGTPVGVHGLARRVAIWRGAACAGLARRLHGACTLYAHACTRRATVRGPTRCPGCGSSAARGRVLWPVQRHGDMGPPVAWARRGPLRLGARPARARVRPCVRLMGVGCLGETGGATRACQPVPPSHAPGYAARGLSLG